jgi:hypothetical protein
MQTVPIIFARNNKIASFFIRLFTLSKWCHCAILDGDYVIDTTLATGCRRILFSEWKQHYTAYEIVDMPIADKELGLRYAYSCIGCKYDWMGIVSYILYKDYQSPDKQFCSELVANYLGIEYKTWSLSPATLYRISKELKGWLL